MSWINSKRNYFMKLILIPIVAFTLLSGCLTKGEKNFNETTEIRSKRIIAYVNEWKDNWGKYKEKANQITHINYAFANIENGKVVLGKESDKEELKKVVALKRINPELKILISVGGWSWSGNFSDAVLTKESREIFANSAVTFMQNHELDGIDLDWEYPGQIGAGNTHRPEDKENFTAILKLLREKLDALSTADGRYLLTIASAANQSYLDHTNMEEAHKYLDFINIMTYDFHGGWEKKTGHHSNLSASKFDDNGGIRSAESAVLQHIAAKIPASKIVLGVPFYGRWWKGTEPKNNGLYQKSNGTSGSYNYNQIMDSLKGDPGYKSYWDSAAQVPFIWRQTDSLFVTYDNLKSIKLKTSFVKDNKLGGIMFWQFNGDNGELLKTISDNLE